MKQKKYVGIIARNSKEWINAYFSVINNGNVAVLINYNLKIIDDITKLLKITKCSSLIYDDKTIISQDDNIDKILKKTKINIQNIINVKSFKNKEINITSKNLLEILETSNSKETSVIIFTTGSTGSPKAVCLSQYNLINNGIGFATKLNKVIGKNLCCTLPLFHSFGLMMLYTYIYLDSDIHLIKDLKIDNIINTIKKYNTTDIVAVGTIYSQLIEHINFKAIKNIIKFGVLGGSASNYEYMKYLEDNFSKSLIVLGYGLSETSAAITVNDEKSPRRKRRTSVGTSLPNTEIRIWDKNNGFLPFGSAGEIVVRGISVMNGYYGLNKKEQPFDSNGWLHTGDIGYLDNENYLYFLGRFKDIIKKKGENIFPLEIEEKLMEIDMIKNAKVIGMPDKLMGESIEACIVLNKGFDLDKNKIIAELKKKNITNFKIPNNFWVFESLPIHENGKINVQELKKRLKKNLQKTNN